MTEKTSGRDALADRLTPILEAISGRDLVDVKAVADELSTRFPATGEFCTELWQACKTGLDEGWLCNREAGGARFSRVVKPGQASVDAVLMSGPAAAHRHPQGEVNLCFGVEGAPRFDGHPPGWVVFPPQSAHTPTVDGGQMFILYFLPGGAIEWLPDHSS